jgi:hypothetical protein
MKALTNFFDNFFPRITISRMMAFESRNRMETGRWLMLATGRGSAARRGAKSAPRRRRMLERLVAGSTLIEVAAGEGLTPRRARELVAEVVAQRGFDP